MGASVSNLLDAGALHAPRTNDTLLFHSIMHPTADGFRVIYDREVPFELRVQESAEGPQQVGTLEAIKVKVLVLVSMMPGCIVLERAGASSNQANQ